MAFLKKDHKDSIMMLNKDFLNLYSLAIAGAIITLGTSIVLLTSILFWFGVTIASIAFFSFCYGIALSSLFIYIIWRKSNYRIKHLFLLFTINILIIAALIAI